MILIPAILAGLLAQEMPKKSHVYKEVGELKIGLDVYRPETELASHYFQAVLPAQFDEYIWFDETRAVTPFGTKELEGVPDTYPFGL